MKQFSFKQLLPHVIAIVIFLVIALFFCKPSLETDTVLQQGDISGWEGMSHQSFQYKDAHGHFPLWAPNMFSGMPGYQIAMDGPTNPLAYVHAVLTLGLPTPINYFFLACICFYILCQCLRLRPWASILGSLAFAYCSFDPIIITAGHNTQMLALAYAPALLGAVILLFEKKYISGFVLTALFSGLEFLQNHQQISYYLFLVMGIMGVAYIIRWIKARETMHMIKAVSLAAVAVVMGILVNANNLYPVYEYAKESKRAGQLVMDNEKKEEVVSGGKTTGLSKPYAFMWSYGKTESFSLMFPGVKGYGLYQSERDGEPYLYPKLDEKSHVAKYLTDKVGVGDEQAGNFALNLSTGLYWGDQPGTNGPIYLGAVICFLFIFGLFYLDGKHKWWLLAASVFGILLAWGSNFAGFNYFLFDHMPLYNKFRVPTMAMVIPQLLFPIMAVLAVNKLMDNNDPEGWKKFGRSVIVTGAIFVVALGIFLSSDFSKENRQWTTQFNEVYFNSQGGDIAAKMDTINKLYPPEKDNQIYANLAINLRGAPDAQSNARGVINALRKDRADLYLDSFVRSFQLVFLLILCLGLYINRQLAEDIFSSAGNRFTSGTKIILRILVFLFASPIIFFALLVKKRITATFLMVFLICLTLIDLIPIANKYLNEKSFENKDKYQDVEHSLSAADKQILRDTAIDHNFRVFNKTGGDPFQESKTSYFHKSIGGYHPAKLGIYDDLASYQLSLDHPNQDVLDMLNAKYIIKSGGRESAPIVDSNKTALGNCWFVKGVSFVKGPVEEMKALNHFNPRDTAFVDEKFKDIVTAYTPADSASTIRQTAFDNDDISYEYNATGNHVAIFSEIYYKDWKAYIDGKPASYFKANYVLRGMVVPAGKHTIEFKFEPTAYYTGITISKVMNWIFILSWLGFIAWLLLPLVKKPNDAEQ